MADLRASGLGGVPKGATADRPSSPSVGDVFYNGDLGYMEMYTAQGWFAATPINPGIPTSVVATNSGSGRAFNNGRASVAFNVGTDGGLPTSFTVTSSPGSYTASGSNSPILVTGLQSNTAYTYTVTATNNFGTSLGSSASTAVTATTVPQAPSVSAAPGNAQAILTITPGATGGSAITGYTIVSSPVTTTQTTSNTTYTFTGLTNDTSYTFTATATNSNGTSTASSVSSSVTPTAFAAAEALVVAGGGGGGALGAGGGGGGVIDFTSVTFTSGTQYNILVGGAGTGSSSNATQGGNSSCANLSATLTAVGGGRGGSYVGTPTGGAGGSGGGGCGGSASSGGSNTSGQGQLGGNNNTNDGTYIDGAGGGGYSSAGGDTTKGTGGAGGQGYLLTSPLTSFAAFSGMTRLSSGGGGGSRQSTGGNFGLGGSGAGNGSTNGNTGGHATSFGSGGGGSGQVGPSQAYGSGGNGKDGVVVIKTLSTVSSTTGSPLLFTNSGFNYYVFTGTGSITF